MGVDSRGKVRGECLECDCSDYETPDRGVRCVYCDCVPTKHQLTNVTRTKPNRQMAVRQTTDKQESNTSYLPPNSLIKNNYFNDLPKLPNLGRDGGTTYTDDRDWATIDNIRSTPISSFPTKKPDVPDDTPKSGISFTGPSKTPDKLKGREIARGPLPSRKSGKEDNSAPKNTQNPGRRRKSVATKVHNLEDIMSSHLSDQRTAERIDKMFRTFDDDSSNELDKEECTRLTGYILEQCGLQPDIIPPFVYDEAFSQYDEDGGGTITLDEFRHFLMSKLRKT